MEGNPTVLSPLLLRNILTSLFIFADKSILPLTDRYRLLQLFRYLLISAFLFVLRLFPALDPPPGNYAYPNKKPPEPENHPSSAGAGDSGIARALSQLLSIMNNIPVSSRKYEIVRSLAERIIEENLREGSEVLRQVNCSALSSAFSRTLSQLESAVVDRERHRNRDRAGSSEDLADGLNSEFKDFKVNRVLRAVRYCSDVAWTRLGKGKRGLEVGVMGGSAEKMAAEILWLAHKMAACGCVEEAVCKWAAATHLAWLALSAEPRLQCSLIKVSAFLFKHARELGQGDEEEINKEQHKQTKMRMLMSWLPLLCRASNGTDTPIMSISERTELERILEDTIETLDQEEAQEKVLSLWVHHFTHCPSSDWPNLHACYTRWCTASRKLLLLQRRVWHGHC